LEFRDPEIFVQIQVAGVALRGTHVGAEENQARAVWQHDRIAFQVNIRLAGEVENIVFKNVRLRFAGRKKNLVAAGGQRIDQRLAGKVERGANLARLQDIADAVSQPGAVPVELILKAVNRKLSELIELWYKLHGCSLIDRKSRLGKLNIICNGMGNPVAASITSKDWAHYRDRRLHGLIQNGYKTSDKSLKVSPGTINCEHAFLRALFNELERLGEISYPNPLKNIREFDQPEKEMAWLTEAQIQKLFAAYKVHDNPDYQNLPFNRMPLE